MNVKDCHEEKIHIPGALQSFGYLIGLDSESKTVTFFSQNLSDIFPVPSLQQLLGRRLEDFSDCFMPVIWSESYKNLGASSPAAESLISIITLAAGRFYMSFTRSGDQIYIEFEKVLREKELHRGADQFGNILAATDPADIWPSLLRAVDHVIWYDRLLVYQFMEDGSGKAIAEHKQGEVESWLNLSFPEFDIPKQAREFYLVNKKRIFSNVFQETVPIISWRSDPVDLTFVQSRAMSPIHGQYVKNMGFCSSFSVSIIIEGKLWGLVTCHNVTPKHIDLMDRQQAEVLTVLAAYAYASYNTQRILQKKLNLAASFETLKNEMTAHTSVQDAAKRHLPQIMELPDADGLAVIIGKDHYTFGKVPDAENLNRLEAWAPAVCTDQVYSNDSFNRNAPPELQLGDACAGVLMICIEKPEPITVIWFRSEYTKKIQWAGIPEKIQVTRKSADNEEEIIFRPRDSFKIYQQELAGLARPWTKLDKNAAAQIRTLFMEMSIDDYFKIQRLKEEIDEVNEELDNFSHTVSHDFNTPLTVMRLNAQMLLRNAADSPGNKEKAETIIRQIDEMVAMMTSVLQHSKTRKYDITLENVAMEHIIRKIADDCKMTFQAPHTQIAVRDCPPVLADATLAYQIFLNVISNAVKYSSKSENPLVEISGETLGDEVVYRITDNGIGIAQEDWEKIFKPYFRTENASPFKGIGVGMSIVKRIMDRIGGSIHFESELGRGTTFILNFKKPS